MSQKTLDSMIDALVPDLKPIVDGIEDGIKTTQDHYGAYMNLIMVLGKDDKSVQGIIALALIKAGANESGVKSALKIAKGG